jgi:hypothetical protein
MISDYLPKQYSSFGLYKNEKFCHERQHIFKPYSDKQSTSLLIALVDTCPKFQVAIARFPYNPPGLDLSKFVPELWRPPNLLSKL